MMELQRTFFVSLLLHGTFAAALFLSAGFLGGSGKMLEEKIFYIDLTAGTGMQKSDHFSISAEEAVPEKPAVEEAIKESVTVKETIKAEEELILTDRQPEGESATVEKSISAKTGGYEGDEYDMTQRSEEEVIVNASYIPPRTGRVGIIKDKKGGILPPGIIELIGSAIEKAKTYPILARKRGMEGTVYVGFSISAEGEPQDILVVKSSGYNILDKATLKVVQKAAPYPHIEDRIEVPVTYRLKDL